jgi:hypothetical protein
LEIHFLPFECVSLNSEILSQGSFLEEFSSRKLSVLTVKLKVNDSQATLFIFLFGAGTLNREEGIEN